METVIRADGKRKRSGTRGSSSFLARVGEMPVRLPVHGTCAVQNQQMIIPTGAEESTTDHGSERPVLPESAGPSDQSPAHQSPALMHFAAVISNNKSRQKNDPHGHLLQTLHAFHMVMNEKTQASEKRIPVGRATWPIPAGLLLGAPNP